jgi:hypothetical protein
MSFQVEHAEASAAAEAACRRWPVGKHQRMTVALVRWRHASDVALRPLIA